VYALADGFAYCDPAGVWPLQRRPGIDCGARQRASVIVGRHARFALEFAFAGGVSAWINMDVGPRLPVAYKDILFRARSELANMRFREGHFIRDIPGYIFYVEKNRDGQFAKRHGGDAPKRDEFLTSIHAPRGRLETDSGTSN